ncbi:MAG: EAL domain-containing protein, partial [Kovacikia sp.]
MIGSKFVISNDLWRGGRSVLISSTIVVGLLLGLRQFSSLESLELLTFDYLTRLSPAREPDSRLLIVGITEQDLQKHGWPLSDQTLAQLLQQLQRHKPKVIGLDLYRNLAQPPGQEKLAQQLQASNLIAITNVGSDPKAETVPPPPNVENTRLGFNDLVLDPDGVVRRSLLFAHTSEQEYFSFALRVSLTYLASQNSSFHYDSKSLRIGKTEFVPLESTSGGYQSLDESGYQILLRYHSPTQLARQVSMNQILSGQVNPEWMRDKVVLIGTVAPSIKDVFYTPYSSSQTTEMMMPGLAVHAQIVSQILDAVAGEKAQYWFWSEREKFLWLWGWSIVSGILAWRFRHPAALTAWGCISLGGIIGIGYGLLLQMGWIPIVEPLFGCLATTALVVSQRLFYGAYRDQLTGLMNREAFLRQLQKSLKQTKASKQPKTLAVLFLDLDHFKLVNEGLGHQAGDLLLVGAAKRLRQTLPKFSKLARVGGDEFAIALQNRTQDQITTIVDALQETLAIPYQLNQQEVRLTVSAGIALTQAEYEHKPEDLLRDAHTAMYRAKSLGKSRYEVFATGMLKEAIDRLQLENDIRQGIEAEEFLLYYQPIICFKTGRITGFEALVRWQHHERGFVSPAAFIPLAEETGLILPLGQWIFQQACYQVAQWKKQFPTYASLNMSVNLSSSQFGQPNLVNLLGQALKQAELGGDAIKVEITESMVMGNVEAAIDLMLQLKSLGLKLSVDDFGTGYSSLSYLHRFPLDTLKVDRSFVSRMDESDEDSAIVQTIITLGQKLGMDIVAEGIEKERQAQMLKEFNCEYGQGYL